MSFFRQIWVVTLLSLEGLPGRLRPSLVMLVGIAGAVAATVSLMALGDSLRSTTMSDIDPSLAIVFSQGAAGESTSDLSAGDVALIAQTPGVRRGADGKPLVDGEAVVQVDVVRKKNGVTDEITLRGVGPAGLAINRKLRLTSGRMFRPGNDELIVGKKAAAAYANLGVGSHISLRAVNWTVVGEYENGGGISETEMMTDAPTELSAFARADFQSAIVELDKPKDFARFNDVLSSNPQLSVVARPYGAYIAGEVRSLTGVLDFVAYLVGAVMALGALFAAVNTLYSAVDARRREIATLRAIGFSGAPIVVSVLIEGMLLSLPGAFLGSLIAWVLFNGNVVDVAGLIFKLTVTPHLLQVSIIWALTIGLIGGSLPAVRAARLPVAT
ncbi:MAG TPA: ABC transporter permease, partial [Caulobacteraceae bacterium]|nr:ABC transporter permease [Caulobacteraceae bacterium]